MLIIKRREGEGLIVEMDGQTAARIVVENISAGEVKVSIRAPDEVNILRDELRRVESRESTGKGQRESIPLATCL